MARLHVVVDLRREHALGDAGVLFPALFLELAKPREASLALFTDALVGIVRRKIELMVTDLVGVGSAAEGRER
jgi:hypothetical protein